MYMVLARHADCVYKVGTFSQCYRWVRQHGVDADIVTKDIPDDC